MIGWTSVLQWACASPPFTTKNCTADPTHCTGAAGLHVGQTDMPVDLARSLLPKDTIIGISVSNVKEAQAAVDSGLVDYVGIGAVWWTGSKDLKGKLCLGVDGVGEVLDVLAEGEKQKGKVIKSVAIGEFLASPATSLLTLLSQVESISPTSLNFFTAVHHLNISKASTESPSYPTSSVPPTRSTQRASCGQC